ncbi:MAG: orotidine-5'-phosphate decarboxylase [Deltaproteobacteria bacterium]|nr:orotidine-5'-phosphate decarboxylase [Deltaproteobacteria bacterium]
MMLTPKQRLIFALDVVSVNEVRQWVRLLKGYVGIFKVGKELFTACGPKAVDIIHSAGSEVFLDLKFHDIPNTVAKAGVAAAGLGVKMFNVHTLGGLKMMEAVREAVDKTCGKGKRPIILGVTILTSMDEKAIKQVGIQGPVKRRVLHLASLAKKAGLDGVVASPLEVKDIKKKLGKGFITVTPGIRMSDSKPDDQSRTMTPKEAISAGADYIVVGRPIREAKDPVAAANKILEEVR